MLKVHVGSHREDGDDDGGEGVREVDRGDAAVVLGACLLYTSPSPRDATLSRMPSSA